MTTQPTHEKYSRPLGTLENFFKKLADTGIPLNREHWFISLVISLDLPPAIQDPAPYLIRTWQILRYQYPALGAVAVPNQEDLQGAPVLTVGPLDANTWAEDTFITQRDENAEVLFSQQRPAPTATCHWIPASKQIILRSSHWRIDGVGMAMLGHAFMTALTDVLQSGLDASFDAYTAHQPMNPPLGLHLESIAQRYLNGSYNDGDNRISRPSTPPDAAEGADALVGEFLKGLPSIGIPTREGSGTAPPGSTGRIFTRLDSATTAKVAAACRQELGVSVTSAVHAAVIRVTASFPQHPLARAYSAFTPVDLRKVLLASGEKESVTPLGLLHSGLPVRIDGVGSNGSDQPSAGKDFKTVARELSAVYSRDLVRFWKTSAGERTISLLELAAPYVRRTTKLFSTPVPEGFPPVQNPDVSSLGRLERYIQREYTFRTADADQEAKLGVRDVWMGTEILWRSMQFHTWSWRDELTLAICYNQSFYEADFVQNVLDRTIEELLTGLGIV